MLKKDVEVHLPNFILVHYVIRHKIIGTKNIRHLKKLGERGERVRAKNC